jgi:hypothetical protein
MKSLLDQIYQSLSTKDSAKIPCTEDEYLELSFYPFYDQIHYYNDVKGSYIIVV